MSLVIVRVLGLATVQDFGRVGHMHEGLPNGGALVRELLVRANRRARNPDGAAAIEVLGQLVVRATTTIEVATDDAVRVMQPGDELAIASEPRRVAYLAIRGGVDAPIILGSRAVHLSAGIGTALRAGMQIAAGNTDAETRAVDAFDDMHAEDRDPPGGALRGIRIIAGPDRDAFDRGAIESLLANAYRISPSSDRVGTRLEGTALARSSTPEVSRPMICGAIEVPRDGQPIVLGPEHPTTGGYPVIAVIASADLGKFFALRLGDRVTFRLA
jgi:biotin-dependent carboxylase-like uncharacterized protein